MNFDFLPGEGANSLRVYATDENGHQFRFPVLDAAPVRSAENVYAVYGLA
jgi:hypothetical protein